MMQFDVVQVKYIGSEEEFENLAIPKHIVVLQVGLLHLHQIRVRNNSNQPAIIQIKRQIYFKNIT